MQAKYYQGLPSFHQWSFSIYILWIQSILLSAFYNPFQLKYTFPLIIAPIYYGGRVGLICKTWLACGLPAVILNLVRDDLRMMAPKPVAAKEGGVKDIAECIGYFLRLSNN